MLPEDRSPSFLRKKLFQPSGGDKYDDVFGGLTQSSYNEELSRVKRVKRK
jgi:hypothetical protein